MRVKTFFFSLIGLLVVLGATGGVLYATGVLTPKVREDVGLGAEAEIRDKRDYHHVADLCDRLDVSRYEKVVPLAADVETYAEDANGEGGIGSYVQCAAEFDVDSGAALNRLAVNYSVRDTEATAKGDMDGVIESYPDYRWEDLAGQWQRGAIGYGNSRATGVTEVYVTAYDGKVFLEVTLTLPGHTEDEPKLAVAAVLTAVEIMELGSSRGPK